MKRGKIWCLLFFVVAIFTVWAVISQSESFSFAQLGSILLSSSPGWVIAAMVSMLGYIIFEGLAIYYIIKAFGYQKSFVKGFLYSAADIYFSAITPSATGGQPASAYFMMKDGIPGAVVTISLMANLIMYTLSLLIVGIVGFVFQPEIFFHFHLLSRLIIILGYVVLFGLAIVFYMLIVKPHILEKMCEITLKFGKKVHLIRNEEKKREKLHNAMTEYRQCADIMAGNKIMFAKAFFYNLLQRLSQITVTLFVYLAIGGSSEMALDIWFTQSYVTIGTYCIPIPGGMGVADYLLIDGFRAFFNKSDAINLELISRGISFYVCMIVSAITVLIGMIYTIKRRNKK